MSENQGEWSRVPQASVSLSLSGTGPGRLTQPLLFHLTHSGVKFHVIHRRGGQGTPTARAPAQPRSGDQLAHSPCLLDEKVLLFMQLVQVSQVPVQQGGLHFFLGCQPQLLLVLALLYSWTLRRKDTCHPCVGAMSPHCTVQNTEVPITLSSPGSVTRSSPGRPSAQPPLGHSPAQPPGPPAPLCLDSKQEKADGDPQA